MASFGVKIPKVKVPVAKMPTIKPPKLDVKPPTVKIPKIDLSFWEGKEKQKIPPATRKKVWEKRFGTRKSGKCFVCGERVIYSDAFHCAHKRADASGGSIRLTNLEPACQRCNLQMGTQDLVAYQKKNYPEQYKKTQAAKKKVEKKPVKKVAKKKVSKK